MASNPTSTRSSLWAFGTALMLIFWCIAWEWFLAPLRPGGSWLILKALPLAFTLKGLYRADNYTMQVSSMLILLYMAEGLVRLSEPGVQFWMALVEVFLSVVTFGALLMHLRPLKKAAKIAAKKNDASHP